MRGRVLWAESVQGQGAWNGSGRFDSVKSGDEECESRLSSAP